MELNSINDYFNIAKNAETVAKFFGLMRRLTYFPEDFTKEEAKELLNIIDNERENLRVMAETFRKMGENVEIIPDENWNKLRNTVLVYLID
jgi:hypothetical protein